MSLISSMIVFGHSTGLASYENWAYNEDHAGQAGCTQHTKELHLADNVNKLPLPSTTSTARIR